VKFRDVMAMLVRDGWLLVRTRGSHRPYKHPIKRGVVTLPGCAATGKTREEVEQRIGEAIEFHIEGMRQEGCSVPPPQAYSTYVEVPA
jgi:predicted RNase H-like HicB family nuclease